MREDRDRPVGDVDALDLSLVEVVGDDGVASAGIGILADPARTEHLAIADLQQTPFEFVGHAVPLRWVWVLFK
jgi:hypothetical protein